jgi:hypothetical protein
MRVRAFEAGHHIYARSKYILRREIKGEAEWGTKRVESMSRKKEIMDE